MERSTKRSTKIKDLITPTCFFLFGISGYSGSGECMYPEKKTCAGCWVNTRRFSVNFQDNSSSPVNRINTKSRRK